MSYIWCECYILYFFNVPFFYYSNPFHLILYRSYSSSIGNDEDENPTPHPHVSIQYEHVSTPYLPRWICNVLVLTPGIYWTRLCDESQAMWVDS